MSTKEKLFAQYRDSYLETKADFDLLARGGFVNIAIIGRFEKRLARAQERGANLMKAYGVTPPQLHDIGEGNDA
jgi:hypothetical protein